LSSKKNGISKHHLHIAGYGILVYIKPLGLISLFLWDAKKVSDLKIAPANIGFVFKKIYHSIFCIRTLYPAPQKPLFWRPAQLFPHLTFRQTFHGTVEAPFFIDSKTLEMMHYAKRHYFHHIMHGLLLLYYSFKKVFHN
jgi:hypothetical protein